MSIHPVVVGSLDAGGVMRVSRLGWVLLGLLWSLKVLLATQLDLFGDEAFYWWEGQHLDWAFDDVPAATPALIALSTGVFGDSAWAVRLPFLLIAAASTALVGLIAHSLNGHPARFERALLIASAMPLAAFNGLLAVPDVPLTFAILCALYGMVRLLQSQGREGAWLLAVGMALGAASHYRWLVPLGVAGAVVLWLPSTRALLARPRIWLFGVGGLLLGALPLAWQQWHAAGRGLLFQLVDRHPWTFQWEKLADPLLQALVVSPVLYGLLWIAAIRSWRASSPSRWLAASGIGLLAAYWSLGLFTDDTRSWLHWPMPAFLAFTPLLASAERQRFERAGMLVAWTCTAVCGVFLLTVMRAPGQLAGTAVYQHNFSGWRDAASMVRANVEASASQPVPLLADDFMLAAEMQFALGPRFTVYAADHPNNTKHGRQSVLATMRRDRAAFDAASSDSARWLLADQSATPLRARAQRAAAWCADHPGMSLIDERFVDHGEKRLFLLRWDGGADTCTLPVFGYLDGRLGPGRQLQGFLLSPGGDALEARARIGATTLPLQVGMAVAGLEHRLPADSDPRLPNVGVGARVADEASGWMTLEARAGTGPWRAVTASRLRDD
ncbi:MAG: glycosyltransferase family 39 protein [Xanthomonadales bacterium]|nr:glycosyltransferase family 39 protein [Xanthomonadales bacterium]